MKAFTTRQILIRLGEAICLFLSSTISFLSYHVILSNEQEVPEYLTGDSPNKQATTVKDYINFKGLLNVIAKGNEHKETGGEEDVVRMEDNELSEKQMAIKALFVLCLGKVDTLEKNSDLEGLCDLVWKSLRDARDKKAKADKDATHAGAQQARSGQEIREMAAGATSMAKEDADWKVLDYTIRHDLVNLILSSHERTTEELRECR